MSRLSLKPGGEPGKWELTLTEVGTYYISNLPDSDLRDIQKTLNEYFEAKEPVSVPGEAPRPPWWKRFAWPWFWGGALLTISLGIWIPFVYTSPVRQIQKPLAYGSVMDELCMRPGVYCELQVHILPSAKKPGIEEDQDDTPNVAPVVEEQ